MDDAVVADRVLMHEGAVEHPRHDLHVAVRVRLETGARGHDVVVGYQQQAEVRVLRPVVRPEVEAVGAVEPADPGLVAVGGPAQVDGGLERDGGHAILQREVVDQSTFCTVVAFRQTPDLPGVLGWRL